MGSGTSEQSACIGLWAHTLSDEARRAVVEREGLLATLRLGEHELRGALTLGEHLRRTNTVSVS